MMNKQTLMKIKAVFWHRNPFQVDCLPKNPHEFSWETASESRKQGTAGVEEQVTLLSRKAGPCLALIQLLCNFDNQKGAWACVLFQGLPLPSIRAYLITFLHTEPHNAYKLH